MQFIEKDMVAKQAKKLIDPEMTPNHNAFLLEQTSRIQKVVCSIVSF